MAGASCEVILVPVREPEDPCVLLQRLELGLLIRLGGHDNRRSHQTALLQAQHFRSNPPPMPTDVPPHLVVHHNVQDQSRFPGTGFDNFAEPPNGPGLVDFEPRVMGPPDVEGRARCTYRFRNTSQSSVARCLLASGGKLGHGS